MSAFVKDILRTIGKERKRLLALMVITILGVTMTTGLKASCDDLRRSADRFFDDHQLHDLTVQSTLGLTEDDVKALESLEAVSLAEGQFSEKVEVETEEGSRSALVKTFTVDGIDEPSVLEGVLPQKAGEIAVTAAYLKDTGKQLGDTLTIIEDLEEPETEEKTEETAAASDDDGLSFDDMENMEDLEEEETPNFPVTEFVITATVTDVTSVSNPEGSVSFRTSSETDYTFFVLPEAVECDYYTAVNLIVDGTKELLTFSDTYEDKVAAVMEQIEDQIVEAREEARYQELVEEATDKLKDAEDTMNEAFEEADEKLADARQELDDGWKELEDGEKELKEEAADARKKIADARKKIRDGVKELEEGNKKLDAAEKQIAEGEAEMRSGGEKLDAAEKQLKDSDAQLTEAEKTLEENKKVLDAGCAELEEGKIALEAGKAELTSQQETAETQIAAGEAVLIEKKEEAQGALSAVEAQGAALAAGFGEYWPADVWNALTSGAESICTGAMQEAAATGQDGGSMDMSALAAGLGSEIAALQEAMGPGWDDNYASLAIGIGQARAAVKVVAAQEQALADQKEQAETQFAAAWDAIETNEAALAEAEEQLEEGEKQWAEGKAQVEAGRSEWEAGRKKTEAGRAEWLKGKQELEDAKKQLEKGRKEARKGQKELESGEAELNEKELEAEQKIADAEQELKEGREELESGEEKYADAVDEYQEKRAEAEEKLADAWDKVNEIEMATWYVTERSDLEGYSTITSDADCIESIGTSFALMFLVIAILISLTTITRMVEEDRGLIGTYQALGFTNREIRTKYTVYSTFACILGGLLGNLAGFVILPKILFIIFGTMYLVPEYYLSWNALYGVGATILFLAGIVGATWYTTHATLSGMPAELMRPKAPKSGSRILLERVPWIWSRLSFLNKVTARNLFRYKKRFLMTVCGIAGCTGLLLCGFAIKDTVDDLMPRQYDDINRYDVMAVSAGGEDNDRLLEYVLSDDVKDHTSLQISSVKLRNAANETVSLQLYVLPEEDALDGYMTCYDVGGEPVRLTDEGFYITENAGKVLGFDAGDTVSVQDLELNVTSGKVIAMVENYLGNMIFVTKTFYEEHMEEYEPNAVLVHLKEGVDPYAFTADLTEQEGILSVNSTQELKDSFSTAFVLINMVVYIVIVLAAALAFVVLFTLATTNISERDRELATIKVLGFYDSEVHRYVNKETLILTGIGILLGLPLGRVLGTMLMMVLKLPAINFAVTVHPISYLISAVLSFIFALLVDTITDRVLDRIDPVEALKSVE